MTRYFDYRLSASDVKGHEDQLLAGGYDLEIGHFRRG